MEGAGEQTDSVRTPDGRIVECPPEFEACYLTLALVALDRYQADHEHADRKLIRWARGAWLLCGPSAAEPTPEATDHD